MEIAYLDNIYIIISLQQNDSREFFLRLSFYLYPITHSDNGLRGVLDFVSRSG